jgi:LPS O-antigen subunit length determinant protein (WzzB/FepE family)
MENTSLKYDLFDVVRVGLKWKKAILGFAILAALIASVYYFLQKTTYKAYGSFFPASAVISGRINLMRETNQDWIDYFGGENEVDRATVVGNSANVISFLIDSFKIAAHYDIDVNDKNAGQKVYKRFMKNFSITRSGFKHIEVNFVDEDHELAAKVVNVAMNKTEEHLRKLYIKINDELANAIAIRKDSLTASLQSTTDSLIAMRVKYGIYDLISPGRKGQTSFTPKSSGAAYAEGLEVIQNLEEIKDRLAMDRAKYLSLYNEFKTATYAGIPMIHVTQWATPHGPKAGPFRTLGVLSVFVISIVFGLLLAVVIDLIEKSKAIRA